MFSFLFNDQLTSEELYFLRDLADKAFKESRTQHDSEDEETCTGCRNMSYALNTLAFIEQKLVDEDPTFERTVYRGT